MIAPCWELQIGTFFPQNMGFSYYLEMDLYCTTSLEIVLQQLCALKMEKRNIINKRLFLMNNYLLKADFSLQRVFEVKSSTNQVQGVQRSLYDFFRSKILGTNYVHLTQTQLVNQHGFYLISLMKKDCRITFLIYLKLHFCILVLHHDLQEDLLFGNGGQK